MHRNNLLIIGSALAIIALYSLATVSRTKYTDAVPVRENSIAVRVPVTVKTWSNVAKEEASLSHLDNYTGLPKSVRDGINTFLLFVGSGKSGHSIVGSLLDAHKHVIVSHEFHLFRNWQDVARNSREEFVENLYKKIYWKSCNDSIGIRKESKKGYTLKVDGLWQGRYSSYVSVIGDKSGGSTSQEYMKNKKLFREHYNTLSNMLPIPIHFIHVIRNPYDHVASRVLYAHVQDISAVSSFKKNLGDKKLSNDKLVLAKTEELLSFYNAEEELIKLFKTENVLDIHLSDLISNPEKVLQEIFAFLHVEVTDHYLRVCADKVYKSTSRARDYIEWPRTVKKLLESAVHDYPFLRRYSFTSD